MASPSIEALMMGILRSVATTAREINGIYVNLTPLRCSYFDFSFSRIFTMRVKSILKTVCTCALVRLESTMRCAMMDLIRLIGTSSPGSAEVTGAAGAAAFAAAGGAGAAEAEADAGAAAGVAAAPCFSRKPSTSSFVMRPPAPVPGTWARSRLFSLAILRTSGEERGVSFTSADAACGAATSAFAGAGAGAGAAGAGAAAPASPPMTPTTVLICTVWPAGTLISVSTPAAGDGISASTLSVEISKRGSSRWTVSPTCLSHLVMVPSKIDSPICGMMTSVFACPLPGAAEAGALAVVSGRASAAGEAAGAWVGAASFGADAAGDPASSITATTVLICTVVPSATLISFSTPAAGEGISASTLSVEISKSGSSRWTLSPGFFSHLVMVPSKIDSPIWGMMTSVGIGSLSLFHAQIWIINSAIWPRSPVLTKPFSLREMRFLLTCEMLQLLRKGERRVLCRAGCGRGQKIFQGFQPQDLLFKHLPEIPGDGMHHTFHRRCRGRLQLHAGHLTVGNPARDD